MKVLVINDLHLGVQRSGGTTRQSAEELREWGHRQHAKLLNIAAEKGCTDVIVNGDLSDVYDLPLAQALEIYSVVDEFLTANPGIRLYWALGNHDLSKDSARLGTVAFIGAILSAKYTNFYLVNSPQPICDGWYVIPHVANQDLFELELDRVPDGTKWLFLHCNFDNKFACQSDHSLDLSRARAKALKERGIKIVLGHEHQGREVLGGNVIIVGNQFPTSVADCLPHGDSQRDGTKHALIIDGDSHRYYTTWCPDDADGWYAEVDWKELADVEEEGRGFIRVVGDATVAESSDAIKAIATFRQRSKSFVVTNAVKVESLESLEELAESIEDVRSVNVAEMLMELLDPKEREVVQSLFEKDEQ